MTGITDEERLDRYRYCVNTLAALSDHRISQETLAEIVSRHVYSPVTVWWVQAHWTTITREVHLTHPNLWVFRPQWQSGYLVGATTLIDYAKVSALSRYRVMRGHILADLRDGNLRAMARLDAEMAEVLRRYEAFIDRDSELEREFQSVLASLGALPMATVAMTRGL